VTSVVLAYTGAPGQRQMAEDRLRSLQPGVVLTPKTSTLVEAQLDDTVVQALASDPHWSVSPPVCADIRGPAFNLKNARARLTGKR
jgi:hypothetical protein